jgi:methylated-DNA-[protein]-cysteine S-methyltransferase
MGVVIMEKFHFTYKTKLGELILIYNHKGVCEVKLPYDNLDSLDGSKYMENEKIRIYLDDYFDGVEPEKLDININVTEFQKKVYDVLCTTKRGSTLTYGDIGKLIGCSSPRAVGQALKKNPVPIIIPCHRVVGKNWDGGFGGETKGEKMDLKKFLLEIEK